MERQWRMVLPGSTLEDFIGNGDYQRNTYQEANDDKPKLDDGMKERVQKLAAARQRTAHWVMREAIEQYVEREEKRQPFWQETFAASEEFNTTGLHLTDDQMDAWITKLESGEDAPLPECHV